MNISDPIEKGPFSGFQIAVILMCFTINMIDGFDIVAISFTAPAIAEAWSIQPKTLGIVFSAALIGMTLGAMFVAPFSDILGRRAMVLLSLIWISIAMLLTGMADTVKQLIALRVMAGLGIGSMLPSVTSMATEYSPKRRRNFVIVFVGTGISFGIVIGGFAAVWLIGEFGWRSVFYVGGSLSLIMFPLVFLYMPESLYFLQRKQPRNALWNINRILRKMKQDSLERMPQLEQSELAKPNVRSLFSPDRKKVTLPLWLAFFMCFMTVYFLVNWIPKIVVDAGLPLDKGIYTSVAYNVGAIAGILLLGYLSDRMGLRPLISWFCITGAVLLVTFGNSPAIVSLLLVINVLLGFFVSGGFNGLYAVAARVYPTEIRTTGIGWAIGAGRTGAIVGPYLGGLLIDLDLPTSHYFIVFALPLIIAAIAVRAIKSMSI